MAAPTEVGSESEQRTLKVRKTTIEDRIVGVKPNVLVGEID
jgi:hypothetical protein